MWGRKCGNPHLESVAGVATVQGQWKGGEGRCDQVAHDALWIVLSPCWCIASSAPPVARSATLLSGMHVFAPPPAPSCFTISSCCILIPATLQGSSPRTSFSPLLLLHSQQSSAHQFLPSYCILNLTGQLPPHVHTRHHAPTRRTPSLHAAPHGVPARNRRHRPCRVPPGGHLCGDERETSCSWVWGGMNLPS